MDPRTRPVVTGKAACAAGALVLVTACGSGGGSRSHAAAASKPSTPRTTQASTSAQSTEPPTTPTQPSTTVATTGPVRTTPTTKATSATTPPTNAPRREASVSLTVEPSPGTTGQTVRLTVEIGATAAPVGNLDIAFGDGSTSGGYQQFYPAWKPCRPGNAPYSFPFAHTYAAPGTYVVRVSGGTCEEVPTTFERTLEVHIVSPTTSTSASTIAPSGTTTTEPPRGS